MIQPTAWPAFISALSHYWKHVMKNSSPSPKHCWTVSLKHDVHKYTQENKFPWYEDQLWSVVWNQKTRHSFKTYISPAANNPQKFGFLVCRETMRCFFFCNLFYFILKKYTLSFKGKLNIKFSPGTAIVLEFSLIF